MGIIADAAVIAFRDGQAAGVPASGSHSLEMTRIRELFSLIEAQFGALGIQSESGAVVFDTLANLNSNLNYPANTKAEVWADSTSANDGVYMKTGPSGFGSWTKGDAVSYVAMASEQSDHATQVLNLAAQISANLGPVFNTAEPAWTMANGATIRKSGAGVWGWTIPAGSSGQTSVVTANIPIDLAVARALAGRTGRLSLGFDTSADYAREITLSLAWVAASTGEVHTYPFTHESDVQSGGRRRIVSNFAFNSDEAFVRISFIQNDSGNAVAEEYVLLTDLDISIEGTPSDVQSLIGENLKLAALRVAHAAARANDVSAGRHGGIDFAHTIPIGPSGYYPTPSTATAAIADASPANPYKLDLQPGVFNDTLNWYMQDDISIVGPGAHLATLAGGQAASTSLEDITANSTVVFNTRGELSGVKITARNQRYALHVDSANVLTDRTQRIRGCVIEHEGNGDAIAYQASISGNPAEVWANAAAVGCGLSSGGRLLIDRSTLISPNCPLFVHTASPFARRAELELTNTRLISTNANGASIILTPSGARRVTSIKIEGCELQGDVLNYSTGWLDASPHNQPAAHTTELDIHGAGNTAAVFQVNDFGRALKIASADISDVSAVTVAGSAANVLFGTPTVVSGKGGLVGYVHGLLDVQESVGVGPASDQFITSLGKRLGDCSSSSKVLSISFQGGSAINVVFNADYRLTPNATILAMINTAIGAAGTASLWAVGERYRPRFFDEERTLFNVTATGIPMGSALAWDAFDRNVRLMTASDNAELFAGLAWEDIYPGGHGRVKTSGYEYLPYVLRTDAVSVGFGDTFSIDAGHPGKVYKGGAQGLLKAIRADAVCVARK